MALLTHTLLNRSAQLMGTEKTGRDVRELETCPAKGKKKIILFLLHNKNRAVSFKAILRQWDREWGDWRWSSAQRFCSCQAYTVPPVPSPERGLAAAARQNPDLAANYSEAEPRIKLLTDTTTLPLSFCLKILTAFKVTFTVNIHFSFPA